MFAVAGGEKDLEFRPQARCLLGKLRPEQAARHHHIGEQQIDLRRPAQYRRCGRPVACHDDAIAELLQLVFDIRAHHVVVLDDENGFAARGRGDLIKRWRAGHVGTPAPGKEKLDGGAAPRLGM